MPASPPVRRRPGFTLIELMIVVFIISILVALTVTVIPRVKRAVYGAQTSAQMAALATSMQAYYGDFRAYPGPLPNNQVGIQYYPTANYTSPNYVYVTDPNNSGAAVPLTLGSGTGTSETFGTFTQVQQITGSENLVLGLLGGLELTYKAGALGSPISNFAFNPANIFPDGHTPAPLGPMVLNPTAPKRLGTYLQVKAGDLSLSSSGMSAGFTDEAGRAAIDSPIPEFMDKFSSPLPILYLRANVGGKAIAGLGGQDDKNAALVDSNNAPVVPQYDLAQVAGYTKSLIGTAPSDGKRNHHGLQGLGAMTDTVAGDPTTPTGWYNAGKNGLAYLKDPNNPGTSNTPNYATSPASYGYPRQKDAFILISAGPDGIYGTEDDIVYPGGSVVQH